jgi:tRNA-dihydrouridine synthase
MNSNSKYDLWNSINCPKYALAPMVDVNDLPFRLLCRRYGAELTFTQMYNVKLFAVQEEYRKDVLSEIDNNLDHPCFIQFCGHDPELMLKSAKYVENITPCVDINLGCPQGIARMGHYGSFLLDHPEEVYKLVGYLCNNNLKCGVSCKIRLFPDLSKTYELVRKLEDLGINVLTVHGRTKEQKAQQCGKCNWDAIKEIKKLVKIPVIANGGLGSFEDIHKCFEYTGCDCVMSGEKLIEMPTFFSKKLYDINDIALEYCDIWKKYKPNEKLNKTYMSQIRGHMFKFFYTACNMHPEYNQKIALTQSLDEVIDIAKNIKELMKDVKLEDKYGWYMRHRKNDKKDKKENKSDLDKNNNINYEDIELDSLF